MKTEIKRAKQSFFLVPEDIFLRYEAKMKQMAI